MTLHYDRDGIVVHHGDCLDVLGTLDDASIDAVVTDPPYGLAFMGRAWDRMPPSLEVMQACYRVLKPGAYLLTFGGTRTFHRLACAVEDAGFEIRDSIAWLYGSGFPKSHDVSKAIDKAAGADREVVGDKLDRPGYHLSGHDSGTGAFGPGIASTTAQTRLASAQITAPATEAAQRWHGWGTALKPAHEPIIVARKPLAGTVAANVLAHGTGALHIDACRIEAIGGSPSVARRESARRSGNTPGRPGEYRDTLEDRTSPQRYIEARSGEASGRWPANVVLDESQAAALDEQSGRSTSPQTVTRGGKRSGDSGLLALGRQDEVPCYGDSGGASRFFYVAKAPQRERPRVEGVAHPTVKPLSLMRWLVRLVTPPGGVVLDPFAGSGTTIEAAMREGVGAVGIERETEYLALIDVRIARQLVGAASDTDDAAAGPRGDDTRTDPIERADADADLALFDIDEGDDDT